MNKSTLERFISKYNLGGLVESVMWESTTDGISTRFASDDKNLVGFISTKSVQLPDGKYNIFDTAQLRSLLSVLGDEITLNPKFNGDRPYAFEMGDGVTKVTAVLADPRAIPAAPTSHKALPSTQLEVPIDSKLMSTFIKAYGALSKSEKDFTILSDGDTAQIVLGYDENVNSNRVQMNLLTVKNEAVVPTHYDANHLVAIFQANKEADRGVLALGMAGAKSLVNVHFPLDGYTIDYYLVGKKRT